MQRVGGPADALGCSGQIGVLGASESSESESKGGRLEGRSWDIGEAGKTGVSGTSASSSSESE